MRPLLFSFFLFHTLLSGSIVDISDLEEILSHVTAKTLVVFDIDNTLLQAKLHLGSVAWGDYMIQSLVDKGVSEEGAKEIMNQLWTAVQPSIPIQPVDEKTSEIINRLQDQGVSLICLTARAPHERSYTHKQLHHIGIDFKGEEELKTFDLDREALFHRNVLFATPFNKKSEVLLHFLGQGALDVEQVIFVDDKYAHVEDVTMNLEKKGIRCVGIRFGGADSQHEEFDPQICAIQWEAFPDIVSNEEAAEILQNGGS